LWLKKNEPDSLRMTAKFTYPSNYIAFWLTGNLAMDRNNAGASSMYDMLDHTWSETLLEQFAIDPSICPPIIEPTSIHGFITKEAAEQTGLKENTPVVAGMADASAEVYSLGMTTPDVCRIRLGSAGDTSFVLDEKTMINGLRDSIIDYIPVKMYVEGNYILTCAQAVKWARAMFWSELPKEAESYAIMDKEAIGVPPGADGLLFHPFLLGENAPYYDASLRAMFHGFCISHERKHVIRAIYEGLSYCFKNILDISGQYDQFKTLYVVGGGTKSNLWLQILVDVLGKEALIPEHCDAAYGAALLAGEVMGFWKTIDLINKDKSITKTIAPIKENTIYYNETFPRFRKIAETKL